MNTMKNIFDISDFVSVLTIEKTTYDLVNRFVKRRKELKLSQKNFLLNLVFLIQALEDLKIVEKYL